MSFLPYPPPPEPGWYDDDATVMPSFVDSAMPGTVQSQPMEQVSMLLEPINDEPANDDEIDWDGTVLSSAFTMKQPELEYTLYNEQTGQEVIIDMGVLLGRKPSVEVPEGAKSVKLRIRRARFHAIMRRSASIRMARYGLRITDRLMARTLFEAMRRPRSSTSL